MRSSANRSIRPLVVTTLTGLTVGSLLILGAGPAIAAATPVPLGSAAAFAVLAATTVSNTGPSIINGDIGLHPGSAVVGFPPGIQATGATYAAVPIALQAKSDASNAFTVASGQTGPTPVATDLTGLTLEPDLYDTGGVLELSGNVILDSTNDPGGIFVFRSASTLITGSGSSVTLAGGTDPCNVFWIVPSSATLGTASDFVGTIIAGVSISATTGSTLIGRLLSLTGAVTLDTTTITTPAGCSPLTINDGTGTTAEFASARTAAEIEAARIAALPRAGLAVTGTESILPAGLAAIVIIAGVVTLGVRRRRLGTL